MMRLVLWLALVIGLTEMAIGSVDFEVQGVHHSTSTPQLWYEGYWKHVDWINGSIYRYPPRDGIPEEWLTGQIIVVRNWVYPYDPVLRELARLRPKAVIMTQKTSGTPGDGMYAVDGGERRSINYPVAEIYTSKDSDFTELPDGTHVEVQFEHNVYKKIKDGLYYPIVNSLMSLWEICIAILGAYRIHQFSLEDASFSLLSIGPLCLSLEIIAALLRFSHTLVDPFWSARLFPNTAQHVLMTIHLPFLLSSGTLLTFYWAETLRRSSIKATPFISHYKKLAIAVVICMFCLEIATVVARVVVKKPSVEPVIFSVIYYLIVSIAIATCYIACCVAIVRKVALLGSNNYDRIRTMNIRFTLSACGYIALIILEIGTYFATHRIWAPQIVWYLLYAALNWISSLQVWTLQPVRRSGSRSTRRPESLTSTSGV